MICDFGCGRIAIKLFKSGRYCCSNATSSCKAMKLKNNTNSNTVKNYEEINWQRMQQEYNNGLSQRELCKKYGFPDSVIQRAVKDDKFVSRSRSDAAKLDAIKNPKTHSEEFKKSQSKNIIKRYEEGWMPKAGRCKKYKHISPIAGEVYLDGTWELAVAKWLDSKEYNWKRNTTRFLYTNLKGGKSHYTPDFWVAELNGYLEVKGYETELDRCKWAQFTEPLTVWKKKELTEMKLI